MEINIEYVNYANDTGYNENVEITDKCYKLLVVETEKIIFNKIVKIMEDMTFEELKNFENDLIIIKRK